MAIQFEEDASPPARAQQMLDLLAGELAGATIEPLVEPALSLAQSLLVGLALHVHPEDGALIKYTPPDGPDRPGHVFELPLRAPIAGEVATRSRLGCGFEVAGEVGPNGKRVFRLEVTAEQERVVLSVPGGGLCTTPLEHAAEVYERLCPVWQEAGAEDGESRRARAWEWWKAEGHDAEYEGGKTWKHVESIAGTVHARAIPAGKLASALAGALCGTRQFMTSFVYSMDEGGCVQVGCELEPDPRAADPEHAYFDAHRVAKQDWAIEIVREHMSSSTDRLLAEQFAPSAANFGLLISRMEELGMSAADPVKIARLFQHGAARIRGGMIVGVQ